MTATSRKYLIFVPLAAVCIVALLAVQSHSRSSFSSSPTGWFAAGSNPEDYDMGIASGIAHSGNSAAYIKSKVAPINGFGTYMQSCEPGKYAGKKVRMTGFVKTQNVADWAGMWFRVDKGRESVSFDNMQNRALKGNTDWTECTITLDVPQDATGLAYGVLLSGTGQVYFDDVKFEAVGTADGKSSGMDGRRSEPTDLDFESK